MNRRCAHGSRCALSVLVTSLNRRHEARTRIGTETAAGTGTGTEIGVATGPGTEIGTERGTETETGPNGATGAIGDSSMS